VQVVGRGARHPCPVLGEEGLALRRAGASPSRACRAVLRTMCGSRTSGWSLSCVMSD
jgi:hypothetical protein